MTEHYVEVYLDEAYRERLSGIREVTDEDYSYRVICSDPEACPGWMECFEDHSGYEPEDYDEVVIHGVLHTEYVYGYGWAVPFPRCPVVESDYELPDGIPVDRPGKYLVDTEWEDTNCYLELVEEVTE